MPCVSLGQVKNHLRKEVCETLMILNSTYKATGSLEHLSDECNNCIVVIRGPPHDSIFFPHHHSRHYNIVHTLHKFGHAQNAFLYHPKSGHATRSGSMTMCERLNFLMCVLVMW